METRAGSGTPVALIHGLSGSSRWWSRNIPVLAEGHLVSAVDLVGFGSNYSFFAPPQLPPFSEVTTLLARWLETFGEPVHLVGHSMGGLIAIHLAAERPELVRSLTLVNAAGIPFTFHPADHLRPLPKPPFGGWRIAQVLLPDFVRAGPTSVAAATARILRDDARAAMHTLRMPVLLVWGENDPLIPLRYGQAMAEEIEGAKLVVLPRAAHVAMWDNAAEFNRVVGEFLEEVEARGPCDVPRGAFCWGISGWTDGIAHRQAGNARDVVLIHGLGMSSAYFARFARALHDRGWSPIAPDILGFGESADASAMTQRATAERLATWADALQIRGATWIGHSLGCNTVAHLAAIRPDLVRMPVFIGPIWTRSSHPMLRLFAALALDALREPFKLYRFVFPAYWRCGLWRWLMTFRRAADDLRATPPAASLCVAGVRDPLADRRVVSLTELDGAHACHFSHPDAMAELIPRPQDEPAFR